MMKKTILFTCLGIAAITGCKKLNEAKPASNSILGNWELRHYSGTIAGSSVDVPPNKGSILVFHPDSTFERYDERKLSASGKFSVTLRSVDLGNKKYDRISFDNNSIENYCVVKSDTLIIGDTMADGVTSVYVKINPYVN